MFRTEKMCEISLLARRQDIAKVTEEIAKRGVLHQVDTSYLSREEDWESEPWQERIQNYQALEERLLRLMEILEVSPVADLEVNTAEDIASDLVEIRSGMLEIEREAMPLVRQIERRRERLAELEALLDRLDPLLDLNVDLSMLRDLEFLHAQIGIVPEANIDRFNASLLHVPHVILTLGEEENGMLVALFGASRDREILERAAHSAYMSPISMPEGYQGTPSSVLRTVQDEIADLLAEQEEASGHVEDLRERWGSTLQRLLRRVRVGLLLLRAMDRYGQVRDVYLVAGWIPEREASDLVSSVQRLTQGRVVADITSADQVGDPSTIPTTLGNRGIIHDFQNLVTTYAFPAYGELDPTPLVALTFVLMFGIMFGDVGHGLVLALLGLAGMKGWVQRLRQLGSLAPILFASGLSAIVFGFLYGSLFGIEDILPTLWIQPLESIMSTLIATVLLGVILSVSGFVLNVINSLRMGDWKRALFGQYGLAGLWFYGSLITLVASVVQGWELPLALIYVNLLLPVILILLGEPLTNLLRKRRPLIHGSKGLYLVTGFFELFEAVISYLSSTLSYVRLGAFAVAHGGLSAVFFILADTVGEPATIAYWAVVLVGNLFIVGFEALVVGIQSLRLEYYEFFSKFFRGGGTPYQPLTLRE